VGVWRRKRTGVKRGLKFSLRGRGESDHNTLFHQVERIELKGGGGQNEPKGDFKGGTKCPKPDREGMKRLDVISCKKGGGEKSIRGNGALVER